MAHIKNTLESKGILTATGKTVWHTSVIQGVLTNEKYVGDILLQKTYVDDFLEGTIKVNRGELPKYYIENNHPAIIPREMFHRAQEEMSRRNSKRPATQKNSKTNRGKFTSRYALSERLVCGICGSHYRRVHWSIHGRREVVWRCINRLEFGKKVCPDSRTMKEENLHRAIVAAVNSLAQGREEEMLSCLQDKLICSTAEGIDLHAIQRQMEEKGREFDRLLSLTGEEESEFLDRKIKQLSDELAALREQKEQAEKWTQEHKNKSSEIKEIIQQVSEEVLALTEYSDSLTYRIIERVTVLSNEEISIRFVGGYEVRQRVK